MEFSPGCVAFSKLSPPLAESAFFPSIKWDNEEGELSYTRRTKCSVQASSALSFSPLGPPHSLCMEDPTMAFAVRSKGHVCFG